MNPTPIKRHKGLQPLSRDHHHGLLLSWKIREGFRRNVDIARIKRYADHFFAQELEPHFELEEQHVFPILGDDHELVRRALTEHRRLRRLFADGNDPQRSLSLIEEELEAHIRFEERVLFQEIQTMATTAQLAEVERIHSTAAEFGKWEDEFWMK